MGAAAVVACMFAPAPAQARRLMSENFEYNQGSLYLQGNWVRHAKNNTDDPIQLIGMPLTYPGYQDSQVAFAAKLKGPTEATAHERLQRSFTDTDPVTEGVVYMSALVNVQTVPAGGDVYFMSMVQRGAKTDATIVDGKSGSEYGRIFVCPGDAAGTFKFGVSKNSASAVVKSGDMQLNTTYLLVLKYEVVEGTTNDIVTLWVNPANTDSDPAGGMTVSSGADSSYGIQGLTMRQATVGTKTGSDMVIDAIRFADSYADLWDGDGGGGDGPQPPVGGDASISTVEKIVDFGTLYQYMSATATVHVSGKELAGPVTVSVPAGFTVNSTSIAAENAMAGFNLEVTYKATAATAPADAILTLRADGAEDVNLPMIANVVPAKAVGTLNTFNLLGEGDENLYYYQGKATVTYVDAPNQIVYAQDISGFAARFWYSYFDKSPVTAGDQFTNLYCMVGEKSFGATSMLMLTEPQIVQQGKEITPLDIDVFELKRDPETYINRLVRLTNVSFDNAGEKFSTATTGITAGGVAASLGVFAATDVIGTEIPASASEVVGISTSASAAVVKVRSLADIVTAAAGEPSLEISARNLIDANEYQPVGKSVNLAELTIEYHNLPVAAPIYITGTNRNMFSADIEEIPAGSGTVKVTVVYTPTAVGLHKANFMIDATPTELSLNRSISAKAYDPDLLPELSVNTEGLQPFSAKVGESMQQTVSYTVANGLDYGTIKVVGASGAFRINSASMMKNGTYDLVVTFAPKAEGSFSDVIELSTDMCQPVSFTVSGSTSGAADPEQRQGDELTLSTFTAGDARALVIEDFENCGNHNKPLAADGWTNAAVEGTRAWWAYTFAYEDNTAAKISAYDSSASQDSPADMLLLSPALDYKNAAQRLLSFRVMGDFLTENPGDVLEVVYIDPVLETDITPATPAEVLENVWIEPVQGLGIPTVGDMNKEWVDYVIDLEGLDLADRFFIGFRYRSTRGMNTTTVYYVDDFSWGRPDQLFIRTDLRELQISATLNTDSYSEAVKVSGLNLDEEIKVSITGSHASKFTTDVSVLPAEGGEVIVKFNSPDEGLHYAYLTLQSAGAPATYVPVVAVNSQGSGISGIYGDDREVEGVYTTSGVRIDHENPAPGVYVIRYADGSAEKRVIR